jgi:hypothetical protein
MSEAGLRADAELRATTSPIKKALSAADTPFRAFSLLFHMPMTVNQT